MYWNSTLLPISMHHYYVNQKIKQTSELDLAVNVGTVVSLLCTLSLCTSSYHVADCQICWARATVRKGGGGSRRGQFLYSGWLCCLLDRAAGKTFQEPWEVLKALLTDTRLRGPCQDANRWNSFCFRPSINYVRERPLSHPNTHMF